MDPVIGAITIILGKYALDKGVELGKEVGPKALEIAGQIFSMVLSRVNQVDARTAQKFPENPEGYKDPMQDTLTKIVKTDPTFTQELNLLLEAYKQQKKTHNETQPTINQQVNQKGKFNTVMGEAHHITIGDTGSLKET